MGDILETYRKHLSTAVHQSSYSLGATTNCLNAGGPACGVSLPDLTRAEGHEAKQRKLLETAVRQHELPPVYSGSCEGTRRNQLVFQS